MCLNFQFHSKVVQIAVISYAVIAVTISSMLLHINGGCFQAKSGSFKRAVTTYGEIKRNCKKMLHILGHFIIKRHFSQNMMIYGALEYCAWLSMNMMFYIWQGIPLMKWFEPHENRQNPTQILDPGFCRTLLILLGYWIQGFAESAGSWTFFLKFWFGKRQNGIGRERGT